jgi:multiple sugar transport system substrate-binding protein
LADVADELARSSSALTREQLLKRGAAAAFSIGMFGGLTDKALGFYGPLKFKDKQLSGELRIMTWAHFVPSYDTWLDNTYVKRWGEANDVEVKVDHINNALLYGTGSSEVAAQSGHDLFWFISPPASFQRQTVPVNDLVQEVSRKLGPMTKVARKSTYNPRTKTFYGFPETYAPDPVQYRKSYLQQANVSLNTWDDLRRGAARLKQQGHPVGLGMSNEIDSNMLLTSLLYCYGGFIQNEENRIVIGQGKNRRGAIQALQVMREIYRTGMTDEVFAWTAASNNQAFLAGRLSVALNAISIVRSAENSGNTELSDDTWLASIPRGPVMRMGNEHVMGVYVIWKFAKNKEAARKYLIDQQLNYREHFMRSQFYNFPPWNGSIQGGFRTIRRLSAQDTHKPRGKYTVLTTIAEKYTTNPGFPGNSTPVMDELYNTFLIPQMFAEVAQGKTSPADAVRTFDRKAKTIWAKWRRQGLV